MKRYQFVAHAANGGLFDTSDPDKTTDSLEEAGRIGHDYYRVLCGCASVTIVDSQTKELYGIDEHGTPMPSGG